MIKKYVFLLFITFIISCKTVNKSRKNNCYLKKIDSVSSLFKGYTIDVPENWYSSYESHCILFHAPRKIKEDKVIYYANKLVIHKGWIKNKDSLINHEKRSLKKIYGGNLNFSLIESKHLFHGEFKILKYGIQWNGINYTNLDFFISNKESTYVIKYSSWNKYYDEYLPDVEKMIKSFRIKS